MIHALTPKAITKETLNYIIDIKYPQGFSQPEVNSVLDTFIAETQKAFLTELNEDDDTPADAPGKTGLNVTYSIPYHSKNALSVRFNLSIYHRGAAHPLNTVIVKNFVNGKTVALADLFLEKTHYLSLIAQFCNKQISAKKISDSNWIAEGTKPTEENFGVWYFTNKGITVLFNNYQVAAYVYGVQRVTVPLSVLSPLIKPELVTVVWSN
ncbi:MAG: DUF3298 domain-containing protein [bacterium]|nr:DUF3298 domain-containing protein [bacterium]